MTVAVLLKVVGPQVEPPPEELELLLEELDRPEELELDELEELDDELDELEEPPPAGRPRWVKDSWKIFQSEPAVLLRARILLVSGMATPLRLL